MIVFVLISGALSAENAEGHGTESHAYDWGNLLWKVANSAILFGGLFYLLRKPITGILQRNSEGISLDINRKEESLKETADRLEELKIRLEQIETEVTELKQAAERSGAEEKKRLEELGTHEAQRILELTEREINHKVENAVGHLKARVADMIIDSFKHDIQTQLDTQTHERIIEKNIDVCGDILARQ